MTDSIPPDLIDKIIADTIKSPCTSFWLRNALMEALHRDCCDAANDAERLALLLKTRADAALDNNLLTQNKNQ